ncbi:K(+)/H(+) antiporter NhaP [Pseudoalteromonas holothuriae]|uniref:K(+)/H(+) antiporter NhaP n=1 Tax=Pseudoalteromonas holothuriae TaxID=2963714 RepID=A0A9W4R2J0_9GAMM|nr:MULTISPECIES: cation:proton antiporter [unclassified Pseudoalteromonas]CAH9063476.1 K(+)/H(+) antiporter NhaP [Pseudoalteromonas sp. CIP111854]CAH9064883.1 K(+)/H(+) antiporter NhaP [Pseudoalteromonas sp. CIP111951]
MTDYALACVGVAIFVYSISVRQLNRAELTGPIWFVSLGGLLGWWFTDSWQFQVQDSTVLLPIIELTLAIVLFSDAAKTRLRVLFHSYKLPLLMLLVALPLTMAIGTLLAYWLLALPWLYAALLAVIISPTDAALCKGFITQKKAPANLTEAINVESGLNDGLCIPIFVFLLAVIKGQTQANGLELLILFGREVGIALLVAVVLAWAAIAAIKAAQKRHLFALNSSPFLFAGIAIAIFSFTEILHGSGFIAVFLSGLLFDKFYQHSFKEQLIEDSELIADFASLLIWVLFGIVVSQTFSFDNNLYAWLYALLAVSVIRIIPVLLSLMLIDISMSEKITLAWFGPKGLASVVLTLMLLQANIDGTELIAHVAAYTILLSVFLHGISTRPIVLRFSQKKQK